MKLNEIRDNPGARKKAKAVGRGIGSGKGKTSGKGQKGQKARSGVAIKGFEGGQMPLYQRLPKSGFSNRRFAKKLAEITLGRLQAAIDAKKLDAAKLVDEDALVKAGIVSNRRDGIKLLAGGELKSKVSLKLTKTSAAAQAAVEKAGGKIELIEKVVAPVVRKKAYK